MTIPPFIAPEERGPLFTYGRMMNPIVISAITGIRSLDTSTVRALGVRVDWQELSQVPDGPQTALREQNGNNFGTEVLVSDESVLTEGHFIRFKPEDATRAWALLDLWQYYESTVQDSWFVGHSITLSGGASVFGYFRGYHPDGRPQESLPRERGPVIPDLKIGSVATTAEAFHARCLEKNLV